MAYKAQINPQSGLSSDIITLKLELDSRIETKIKVENATHRLIIDEFTLSPNETKVERQFNLKIPEYSSDSMISIFVNIEVKENDKFKLVQVLPLIYYVNESILAQSNILFNVSPSFVSQDDICKISVKGQIDDKYVISINDKRFNIIIGPSGFGSIHFKTKDVVTGGSQKVSHKFPIYYYSKDDNYINKYFSGNYVNIVPNDIIAAADEDLRCDTYDPLTWTPPGYCDDVGGIDDTDIEDPEIPNNEVPKIECDYDDCNSRPCTCESINTDINEDACRIHKESNVLISNGMVLNSYVSVDNKVTSSEESYNKQRVFIDADYSALTAQIVGSHNVAVLAKEADEDFTIYITEEFYDIMLSRQTEAKRTMAVLMDENMNYAAYEVKEVQDADEYLLLPSLVLDREDSLVTLNQNYPCVYAVFYEIDGSGIVDPSVVIPSNIEKLPFIDIVGDGSQSFTATNVSISSDDNYRGADGESFVHVIAEARYLDKTQLFYYGFSIGPLGYSSTNSENWVILTTDGSNKNAKTLTDEYNNLHIFWESDRTGLDQIYYGVIGPSAVFYSNAALSSIIDKKVELDNKEDKPFGYMAQNIIESTGETLSRISEQGVIDGDTGVLVYPNKGIVGTAWIKNETEGGSVIISDTDDISEITISSSTLSDTAVAFTKLDRDSFFDLSSGLLSQINYQVSFGFNGEITEDVSGTSELLSQDDIDVLYDTFKSQFTETVDTNIINNLPYYVLDNNRFNIGIENEIYDRFIPIMGSYKNEELQNHTEGDTITDDFAIIASGDNRNLNHFFLAVIPEKVRFKATNIEDELDFETRAGLTSDYNEEEIQEYYTGLAALAVVYTTDDNLSTGHLSNVMVRNISKPFILSDTTDIDVLINYSKMFEEDTARYLNIPTSLVDDFPRFACNLSVMIGGEAKFSESFIVDMSDKYRAFDIGLGVTSKGSFKADNFYPYNSSVFENASVIFNYSGVTISSPTYQFNTDVASVPGYVREQLDLSTYDFYGNEEDSPERFFDNYDLLFDGQIIDPSTGESLGYQPISDPSTGVMFDISTQQAFSFIDFMQIPVTLEGVNSNASISLDFANNVHLTWQSNRDKNWNIFYSSSINKNIPFRFDTSITDTESNSLSPDISTDETGKRMIVWHDDRNGSFDIFSARTLETYNLEDKPCENIDTLIGITINDNPSQSIVQTDSSVISFSQSNNDPSVGILNLHFRVTFYSDINKDRVVYSSFSLVDDKRWYISSSTYDAMSSAGVSISTDETVDIIYVPDIYPHQLFSQQRLISLESGSSESSLLSGVKYYITIESYDIDTGSLSLVSNSEFRFDASNVETNFWREDLDKNNWICSSQGQDDLLVSNSGEQSIFSSVTSNIFGLFYIVNQSLNNGTTVIKRSFWNTSLDNIYGSGQGLWETDGPFEGQRPTAITDQGQNFYIVSSDDTKIYSSKCALPPTEKTVDDPSVSAIVEGIEDLCIPGTSSSAGGIYMRVSEEDESGSFVINKDDIVSVVDKTDIHMDISGIYGAYGVRFRNQDGNWSDWINVNNNAFIENNRFVIPWTIPRVNGVRHLCCQVLTIYGISTVKCIDIFVNMETVDYFVDYYSTSARIEDVEVPAKDGFSLLATKGEDSAEIFIRVTFNQPQSYNSLTFDVVHQGISNIFNEALTSETSLPTSSYTGSFVIRKEDGIFDKDGIGFLKVKFPDEDASIDNCVSDRRDLYNQMLIKSELDFLDIVEQSPEDAFRENATKTPLKVLDINEFKQYYDNDDPDFLFGDAGFYRN